MSDTTSTRRQQIRVLVARITGSLFQQMARVIEQQPDMRLVGHVQDRVELLLAAENADVIVLGSPQLDPPPGISSHLLTEFPDLKILVVSTEDGGMVIYWRALQQLRLSTGSITALQTAIRQAAALDL